jgi:hypothetical protein
MAVRIPERKYIESLIVGGFNSNMISEDLTNKKILLPTPTKLKEIYDDITSDAEFNKTSPSADWLEDRGIASMYSYRFKHSFDDVSVKGIENAFKMLEDPQMRKFMYALSLAGIPDEDVELIINGRYDITYETPDFQAFAQYFANFDDWGHIDKELYVDAIQDLELKKLFKLALKKDRFYLVWKLGLGTDPSISFDGLMRDMMVDSYFMFKEKMKNFPDEAQKFGALAVKLSDRIDKIDEEKKSTSDLLSDLKFKLVVERTDTENVHIQDADILKVDIPEKQSTAIPDLTELVKD